MMAGIAADGLSPLAGISARDRNKGGEGTTVCGFGAAAAAGGETFVAAGAGAGRGSDEGAEGGAGILSCATSGDALSSETPSCEPWPCEPCGASLRSSIFSAVCGLAASIACSNGDGSTAPEVDGSAASGACHWNASSRPETGETGRHLSET